MEIMESIRIAFEELIVPEPDQIKEENRKISALGVTSKRLDDVNIHLADQSRRIDSLREELKSEIRSIREELSSAIKETNRCMDRLYEVIVRREEHSEVVQRLTAFEREVGELKRKLAA
jgi:uncharacterized protein Yka (UPF0111/DUF47 family)